jgi:hypothetical protein
VKLFALLKADMHELHDFFQTLILALSLVSNISWLAMRAVKRERAETEAPPGRDPSYTTQGKPSYTHFTREIVDLGFVLICSAFFSLLLTDSLLISGRNPSPGLGTILIGAVIAIFVALTMYGAWYLGFAELITGVMALTTLAVLLLSSGGPFFASESDTVAGLSLLIPTISLVIVAATMLIYFFGNPLSRNVDKRTRVGVSLVLLATALFASIALGEALVVDVLADPRTPKVGQGQGLIHSVMQGGLQDRREFYRLASEVSLARSYQKYFRSLSQEQRSIQAERGTSNNGPEQVPKSNTVVTGSPTNSSEFRALPTPTPSNDRALQNGPAEDAEVAKEEGIARANFLTDYFDAAEFAAKEQYLVLRLGWVHPVGLAGQSAAAISLPGTTPDERFEGVSSLRVFLALYDQPNFRQEILKEFEYPEQIRNFFRDRDEKTDSRIGLFSQFQSSAPSSLYKPTLFPKFDFTINNSQLKQQLSLPLKPEAYVAFKQYKSLATLIVQEEFRNRLPTTDFERLTNAFNTLDDQAQDAFLNYVVNNRKIPPERVYQTLIDLKGIDFNTLVTSQDPLAVEKLISILQGNRLANLALEDLADRISRSESKEAKETFLELLKDENSEFPIKRLFEAQVFDLVDQIHKFLGSDKRQFFDAVADPIWVVANHIAVADSARVTPTTQPDRFPLNSYLNDFRRLDDDDKAGLLQQLAISLYQPGGAYSLDPIRLTVSQAKSLNNPAGLFCAAFLPFLILLLCLFIGGFLSRKLVARDRSRVLIKEELANYPDEASTFGNPVEALYGREEVLRTLGKLAERGWSTIGVVGRRGVGKTRVLRSLLRSELGEGESSTVKAWVSAPSKFQEEDFVFSIFERLALSTEATIASYLDASPISIRKIERRAAVVAVWFYLAILSVLGIIIYEMFNRLTRSDIVVAWLPIVVLVLSSVVVFVHYLSKRQPVDLSSWLQRSRKHNQHTVMLYKEVYDALVVLRNRRRGRSPGLYGRPRGDALRQLAMTGFAMLFSLSIGFIVLSIDNPYSDLSLMLTLVIAGLSCWAWLYLFQRRVNAEERTTGFGQSIMSLIADYRSFATAIVYRLSQGALGHSPDRKFSVLICIDELDKILDLEDIRQLLRKIKAIFEVPGVYYYVSLAEDTLTALYLGPASGKGEIDSAFDHIVSIQPLSASVGETIASEYLTVHGFSNQPDRLARVIAAVAFGIPRDIIRRCDELIAQDDQTSVRPARVAMQLREVQARLGYELHQLSKGQMQEFMGAPTSAALAAQSLLGENLDDADSDRSRHEAQQRLILSVWVLSLIEAASALENDQQWKELTEELSALGYRLPIDPIADLRAATETLHIGLVESNPAPVTAESAAVPTDD